MLNKAEARVATWIRDEFGLGSERSGTGDGNRVDFFCVAVGGTLHIVEIKRGKHVATAKDILQAEKYRAYVLKRFTELSDPKAIKYSHVQSHLIAAELHADAANLKTSYANSGWVFFTTWDDLIERAKQSHHQFHDILVQRTSESDEVPSGAGASDSTSRDNIGSIPKSTIGKRKVTKKKKSSGKRSKHK